LKINVRKLLLKLIIKGAYGCARLNTLIQCFVSLIARKVDYKMILIGTTLVLMKNHTCVWRNISNTACAIRTRAIFH
jgi:hypothetical protein